MKYLKIEDSKGLYWDGSEYQDIDKINKSDLLKLLNSAEANDFELDPYDESLLENKAHQIIYENIYNKLEQFLSDKDQFKREVDELYKEAINKYSVEIKADEDVNDEDSEIEGDEDVNDEDSEIEGNEDVKIEDLPF
jgi:hypothetical protein